MIDDSAHLFAAHVTRPAASADAAPYFLRHVLQPRAPQVVSLVQPDLASLAALNEWMSLTRTPVLNPAALTVAAGSRRYSFYSPELNLLAETALASSGAPAIAYEYIWFNGHPVAQLDNGGATHWTFTDHLGTPSPSRTPTVRSTGAPNTNPSAPSSRCDRPMSTSRSASPARRPNKSTSARTE